MYQLIASYGLYLIDVIAIAAKGEGVVIIMPMEIDLKTGYSEVESYSSALKSFKLTSSLVCLILHPKCFKVISPLDYH